MDNPVHPLQRDSRPDLVRIDPVHGAERATAAVGGGTDGASSESLKARNSRPEPWVEIRANDYTTVPFCNPVRG